jgi:copper chaperone CopZ
VVQEALAGLPGVLAVDVDLNSELLRVQYDPARVAVERIQAVVDELDVGGLVVRDEP